MRKPGAQSDRAQSFRRRGARRRECDAPDRKRHRDIVERRKFRQQMMKLVDEAQLLIAQGTALSVGQGREIPFADLHNAAIDSVQSTKAMQKSALARARRTDDRDHFSRRDAEVGSAQHQHRAGIVEFLLQSWRQCAVALLLGNDAAHQLGPLQKNSPYAARPQYGATHNAAPRPDARAPRASWDKASLPARARGK